MEKENRTEFLPGPFWAKILVLCAYLFIGIGALFVLARIIPAASPFIVAWLVAWALARPIAWISTRTRMKRGIIAAGVTTAVIAVLIFGVFKLGNLLISEAGGLLEYIGENASGIEQRMSDMTRLLGEKFPSLDGLGGGRAIESGLNELFNGIFSRVTSFVTELAAGIVKSAPSVILFVIVTVVSAFYFTCGYPSIKAGFCRIIPASGRNKLFDFISSALDMVKFYLRSNVIICGVTFVILVCGFMIMRFEYVALTAVLTALIDFLPVFGVGIVLIPWGLLEMIGGDYCAGFGLLILYACCVLARQLLEPRLISEKVGLHPAATLAAMYFGYRFLGFLGMIFLPLAITLILGAHRKSTLKKAETDGKDGI